MKILILLISFLTFSNKNVENIKEYSDKEMKILQDINTYRNSLGLTSLENNAFVSTICLEHNHYMISSGEFSHNGFENRAEKIKKHTNTTKIGECLSHNFDNPVPEWIRSEPHRRTLETASYTKIGISFKEGYCTIILIR